MVDEHDHLLDAVVALDTRIGRKPAQSFGTGESGELPEDVTEFQTNAMWRQAVAEDPKLMLTGEQVNIDTWRAFRKSMQTALADHSVAISDHDTDLITRFVWEEIVKREILSCPETRDTNGGFRWSLNLPS